MGTVKYTGPVASFHCPTNAEIRSLKVHFSPKQEGTGDPSPDNVREIVGWDGVVAEKSGKNLWGSSAMKEAIANVFPVISTDNNIITYSNTGAQQADGTILFSSFKPNTQYTLILTYSKSTNVYTHIAFLYSDGNFTMHNRVAPDNPNTKTTEVYVSKADKTLAAIIRKADEYSNVTLYCDESGLFEGVITKSEFEPYHGETIDYEFGVLGKNKLNVGTIQFNHYKQYRLNDNPIPPGTYTLSANVVSNDTDADKSYVLFRSGSSSMLIEDGATLVRNIKDSKTVTFKNPITEITFYAGTTYSNSVGDTATWSEVQLELGSTATAYEPYNPNHTVYGGWVDLISGEVCEEQVIWNVDDMTIIRGNPDEYNGETGQRFSYSYSTGSNIDFSDDINDISICNIFPTVVTTNGSSGAKQINWLSVYKGWGRNTIYGCVSTSLLNEDTSVENIQAFLRNNDFKVSIKLQTPNTYHLAPTQLQTFLGQNNVWSNADYVEVEYDLHETQTILARKQFIIANQPHLVSPVAAPLQNFVTDMVAPLKECKVYFSPVQEGSGDPSPDNVRAITGWTNVGIMHKNGLPSEYQAVEYLQSTGTQFITGYFTPPTTGVVTLKVILEPESMNDNFWYCGGRSSGHMSMQVGRYGETWYKDKNSDIYEVISVTNGIEKIFCSKSSNGSSSYDYLLFGRAWDGSYPYNCKIFQCTLYFNDTPIYNYIPCYRKIDNVAGMYDTVNNVFYTNEGTGTFITGQDIQALPRPLLFESTHSFDWGSTFGTIYGGYVDLVKGEIVAEWIAFDMTQLSLQQFGTGTNVNTISAFPGTIKSRNAMYCNILTPTSNPNVSGTEGIDWNNGRVNICLSASRGLDSQSKVEQWLNDLKNNGTTPLIVANMFTPTIYTIAPQTLKTLRGTNNIWSNAGDIILSYWKH